MQTLIVTALVALAALYSLWHLMRQMRRHIGGGASRKPACNAGCARCNACALGAATDAGENSVEQAVVFHPRRRS